MKNLSLNLLFLLFTTSLLAQIQFEKGYFINNQGDKIECLIKNADWNNSPDHFLYMNDVDSAVMEISINDVKEFQIFDTDHYFIRHKLSNNLQKSESKIGKKQNDLIFLRVLVEGTASLFTYNQERKYFFYNLNDKELTFIEYSQSIDENNKIVEKNPFRKTLYDDLRCKTFSVETFSKLRYGYGDLINLFIAYNSCMNSGYTDFYDKRTKGKFNFKLMTKLNVDAPANVTYSFNDVASSPSGGNPSGIKNDVDFKNETNLSLGIEIEYLLPFLRNKWSIFFAPNIHRYSSEFQSNELYGRYYNDILVTTDAEYTYTELPLGIRYYMFLNDNYKLFAHVAISKNIVLNSKENRYVEYAGDEIDFSYRKIDKKNNNLSFGFGCQYKNKLALAINYYPVKNLTGDIFKMNMKGSFALDASYTIF